MRQEEEEETGEVNKLPFVNQDTKNTMYDLLGKVLSDRAHYVDALRLQVLLEPFVERLKHLAVIHPKSDYDITDPRNYTTFQSINLRDAFK